MFFRFQSHKGAATTKHLPHREVPSKNRQPIDFSFSFFLYGVGKDSALRKHVIFSIILSSQSMECEYFLLVKVTSLLKYVTCGDTHFNVTSYQPVVLCAQGEVDAAACVFLALFAPEYELQKMRSFEMQSLPSLRVLSPAFNQMQYPEVMRSIKLPILISGKIRTRLISGLVIIAIEHTWPSV